MQARCKTVYTLRPNNMKPLLTIDASTGVDCRSHHLLQKVQSITLPMPAWESAEGRDGRQKGLAELPHMARRPRRPIDDRNP